MIVEAREAVFDYLDATFTEAVFHWLPDDMTELPCLVVGGLEGTLYPVPGTSTMPVFVIGRGTNDESQLELDVLTDAVNLLLVKGVPDLQGRLISYTKGLQSIGGSEFPSYVLTLEVFGNYC